MRNKKIQICKEGKLIGPSQAGGDLFDTAVGTATDLFAHHGLPRMGKKAVEMGRYYESEALRNPKVQKKAIDYALDKLNPMIQNVGSQALDQLSTKIRPNKGYKTDRKDLGGAGFNRRRFIVNGIDKIWCSHLVEMQQFSKWNKGYRYLLMVLDLFSKYGWIFPLKDKKGETVTEAFKTIFKEGRKPQYLWTDKGKEYYNKNMKELLEKNNITLYSTENEEKSSVCERWNRTIKTKMWKQFTVQGNTVYLDILPKILEQYNNTKHSSIKMTPVEASKKKNESTVYFNLYGNMEQLLSKPRFKTGDKVRISK